ncbi:hypothetical protein GCM10011401_22660 [Nesterenkonia cremea]|uniref:Uncharacterized protein n=1 Tax=Nesterenkonia cremea TaxID=1882340 RepID=A0A917ESN6_9MICC|nr:hypothetical protein GCM10011401_22660 [Nesterenkonia cremea]
MVTDELDPRLELLDAAAQGFAQIHCHSHTQLLLPRVELLVRTSLRGAGSGVGLRRRWVIGHGNLRTVVAVTQ